MSYPNRPDRTLAANTRSSQANNTNRAIDSDGRPGFASTDPLLLCPCILYRYLDFARRISHPTIQEAERFGPKLPIVFTVIGTLRDLTRQHYYLRTGVSWTIDSKHLAQPPNDLSLAFDIAIVPYLSIKHWNPGGPLWLEAGRIGRACRLDWGGDWTGRRKDYPHFDLPECLCQDLTRDEWAVIAKYRETREATVLPARPSD